jgi:hypothetical protein
VQFLNIFLHFGMDKMYQRALLKKNTFTFPFFSEFCLATLAGFSHRRSHIATLWRSVVKWWGSSAQDQGSRSPGLTWSFYLYMCSPVQLDWFIKGRVIHAHNNPWDLSKRVCESPQSRASNSGWSLNYLASMAHNRSESRWISPVPGFQLWLKSELLGLNGTQPQWE